jgi:hypothetical protein
MPVAGKNGAGTAIMDQWLYGFAVGVLLTLFFVFNVRHAITDWREGRYWARLMKEAKTDEEWAEATRGGG